MIDEAAGDCPTCPRWETWRNLRSAFYQDWFGFGGAWGEPGPTEQTTGALGPHGSWADGTPEDNYRRSRRWVED